MSKSLHLSKARHHLAHWSWWQVAGLSVIVYGAFTLLLTLFPPPPSLTSLWVGIGLTVVGTVASIWSWRAYNWWARFVVMSVWPTLILGMAIRSWAAVIPVIWVWLIPLLTAYLLAWALPALNPALSALLWREQTAPQTRLGRGCLVLMLTLAPVAGTIGASVGMFGSRFSEDRAPVYLIMGSLSSIVAIVMAQSFAHQLWPQRPWRKDEPEQENKK